jgi:hypothetical protein
VQQPLVGALQQVQAALLQPPAGAGQPLEGAQLHGGRDAAGQNALQREPYAQRAASAL